VTLFVAGQIMTQPQEELSGSTAMLSCGRDPLEPVQWTFQASPASVVKSIKFAEGLHIHGSSLYIRHVGASDSGCYNCIDAADELHHRIQLTVIGKLYKLFF